VRDGAGGIVGLEGAVRQELDVPPGLVGPVVVPRAEEDEVREVGRAAVLPVADVVTSHHDG
jgi:hypothetical protein